MKNQRVTRNRGGQSAVAGHSIELGGGDNDAVGFSLQARQPLFTGYKITSGIARAELAVHSSRESYRKTVQSERFELPRPSGIWWRPPSSCV
ncbi:MAG: TolC family protein [Spirochaetota bacterium]